MNCCKIEIVEEIEIVSEAAIQTNHGFKRKINSSDYQHISSKAGR